MTKMRAFNVAAQLINTPKEAGVGCGLSLKFPLSAEKSVKNIIANMRYSSFYGYMRIGFKGGKISIKGF
ncbi:MAG: DUF3343 domain-containing protein [Roseburia sp.]|nr:DUF3343 domain-containing protein [Roseburia sp.]